MTIFSATYSFLRSRARMDKLFPPATDGVLGYFVPFRLLSNESIHCYNVHYDSRLTFCTSPPPSSDESVATPEPTLNGWGGS